MYQSEDRDALLYNAFEMDCDAIVAQRARVKVPVPKMVQQALEDVGKDAAKQVRQDPQQKKQRSSTPAHRLIRKRRHYGTLGRPG